MKKFLLFSLLVIVFCFVEAKPLRLIHVYNGTQTGSSDLIINYTISSGDSLMVKAWKYYSLPTLHIDSISTVDWYVDGVYQFTASGMVTFNHPGLISFPGSENEVQLSVTIGINDIGFSKLPFPSSQVASNVDVNNLRYIVLDLLGNIVDEGNFSGKIILRDTRPQNPIHPGIYFVIYYDGLNNRQVVTDKVYIDTRPSRHSQHSNFVSENQPLAVAAQTLFGLYYKLLYICALFIK